MNFYSLCLNNNNCLTIFEQIFVTEIFKPQLLSSNSSRLRTRLTELLLTQFESALSWILYDKVISLMNVLEGECSWLCLLEISINLNIVLYVIFVYVLFVYIFSCSVCRFIFVYHFYAGVCCCIFVYLFTVLRLTDVKAKHQYLNSSFA